MPVRICITSTSAASEPKSYQKLKFFGATYLPHWLFQSAESGKRSSIQVSSLLIARGPSRLGVFPDHDARVGQVFMRRNDQVGRRGHALQHASGEVELRLVARAKEAAEPVLAQIGRRHFRAVRRRAAEVRADADGHPQCGLDRARLVLAVRRLLRDLGLRV